MTIRKSIKKRRKQAREEIIEDILQIAREMMQKDGVGALSFNAIARELGIKPPSLYTYFDSKHAIYDALFGRGFLMMEELMDQHIEGETVEQLIESFFRTYMNFARENPDLFQIMFQRPIPDFVPSPETMAVSLQALTDGQNRLRGILDNLGIEPGIPVDQVLDILIAMNHGLAALHLANHPDLEVGEGRFGQIIEPAVKILAAAWKPDTTGD